MIKYNKNMRICLDSIQKSNKDFEDKVMRIWPEFIEIEGFILLKKDDNISKKFNKKKILSAYYDETAFEASYNEFRIEDYFDWCIKDAEQGLILGNKLSEIWEFKLKKCFPNYKFHIIIEFDGKFTTIRFYRLRKNEDSWISLNDLDEYNKSIAIRIIE